MRNLFTVLMAEAGVNSAGMRADGRAASNETVQASIAQNVRTALDAAERGETSNVHVIANGQVIDDKLVKKGVECISQSAREGATLTNKMFNLIRECKTLDIAVGTLQSAETKAIMLADERSTAKGGPRIKTLAALAEENGMDKLSYVQIKSNLLKAHTDRKERGDYVQDYYNLKERIEKAPKTELQAGWLDIWSDRYADPKEGSKLFMKDVRFSAMCRVESDRMRKQLQREAAARNEGQRQANANAGVADTATNGANGGIRSGGGNNGQDVIPAEVQPVLANFQRRLQDACRVLTVELVNLCLQDFMSVLNNHILKALEEEKAKKDAPTDDVQPPEIAEEQLILDTKPEWYTKEQWLGFSEEKRQGILSDPESDKDGAEYIAWEASQPLSEDEEASIVEQGAEINDAANG